MIQTGIWSWLLSPSLLSCFFHHYPFCCLSLHSEIKMEVFIFFFVFTSVADPGCLIPDPNFFHPGTSSKNLCILTQKLFLSSRKYDPGCSSRIRILIFYPSRIQGVKKAPDPGSATQVFTNCMIADEVLHVSRPLLAPALLCGGGWEGENCRLRFGQGKYRTVTNTQRYIECLNRQSSLVINIVGTDDISRLPRLASG